MSKLKNAELEERALEVAGKLLTIIEHEVDLLDGQRNKADVKKLKKLVHTFNTLKPFF